MQIQILTNTSTSRTHTHVNTNTATHAHDTFLAFLTQKLDDCGQTVVFEAFLLVQQVLNPKGFVRKAYKSADSSLGIAISSEENTWVQEGLPTVRQWDWMGSWYNYRRDWKKLDNTHSLTFAMIKDFCEKAEDVEEDLNRLN